MNKKNKMDQQIEEHEQPEEEEHSLEACLSKPRIFEGNWQQEVPIGFDTVTIYLDGRLQADLDWKKERKEAQRARDGGYNIFWDIQLGLFKDLSLPLDNQSQFLSLILSLEHFRDSLGKEFKDQTVGLSFFRGKADFAQGFFWNAGQKDNLKDWLQENCGIDHREFDQSFSHPDRELLISLFCRDVAVEYLSLLANRLPDSLPAYLFLDASTMTLSHQIQHLNPERFTRLHLALKNPLIPIEAWGWETPSSLGYSGYLPKELPSVQCSTIGVCIPPLNVYLPQHYRGLEKGLLALHEKKLPYKLIAESQLTSQWDGLDYLLFSPSGLSVQGKRKLQGFCAAGGTIVSTEYLLGFPLERSLGDWINHDRR